MQRLSCQRSGGGTAAAAGAGAKLPGRGCRYANAQPVVSCPSQFADVAPTTVATYCPSRSIQLNGSSIPLFNSTTYYDKMLWAATWMYKVRRAAAQHQLVCQHGACGDGSCTAWVHGQALRQRGGSHLYVVVCILTPSAPASLAAQHSDPPSTTLCSPPQSCTPCAGHKR